jgi:hypothetical protein
MQLTNKKVFRTIFREIHKVEHKKEYSTEFNGVPLYDIIKMHLWSIMYDLKLQNNPKSKKRLKMFTEKEIK